MMLYNAQELSALAALHSMLETDPPRNATDFAKVFIRIKDDCGISFEYCAPHIGRSVSELEAWVTQERLPTRFEYRQIIQMVTQFVWSQLHEEDPFLKT